MEIEVKIRALMMDPNSGTPIIILKDVDSDTMLPIWVGAYEANAIALEIEKIAPPRPMTHDLLRNIMGELGVHLETCANEASAAAMLGASINYPLRGAVTWKSIVGTNVAADALSNLASLTNGTTDHLRVTLTLPSGAGNTLQNQSSTISYAFTGTQRAATNK